MKNLVNGLIATIIFGFIGNAQSSILHNSITNEGVIGFSAKLKKVYDVRNAATILAPDEERHTLKYIFTCDETMQKFNSESELKIFLQNNPNETSGKYEIFVDAELEYSVEILNGQKINEKTYIITNALRTRCTFESLRKCAVKRIHDQNWFDMTLCVIEGFNCFLIHYGSCAADNCQFR